VSPRRRRDQRGQSTVEFALVVPLIAIALLAVVQVGLVVLTKLSVTHTAREVARVLAIDPTVDPARIANAVHSAGDDRRIEVEWEPAPVGGARMVFVRVEERVPRLTGPVGPALRVTATVVMLGEGP